jgi:hypothetical protein
MFIRCFLIDKIPYKIVKYEDLFDSDTYDIYNYNEVNYSKSPVNCLSYSLYRNSRLDLEKQIKYCSPMLLNLYQTCIYLNEHKEKFQGDIRLYISHNLFLMTEEEKSIPQIRENFVYIIHILNELL